MHLLYGNGSGEVYLAMVEWLDAADADLVTTAVLALGNFARTDTHCLHMMDSGVFAQLLSKFYSYILTPDQKSAGSDYVGVIKFVRVESVTR